MNKFAYFLFLLGVGGFFYGYESGNLIIQTLSKPIPLIILIIFVNKNNIYGKLIAIGFVFSLIGDILLAKALNLFLFGLISFLTAHIMYIIAFVNNEKETALIKSIPFYMYGAVLFIILKPHLGDMTVPVLFYVIVITTMLWRAFVQRKSSDVANWAFVGALFFTVSDTMIAIYRFNQHFMFDRELTIITYWIAQYLIFISVKEKE